MFRDCDKEFIVFFFFFPSFYFILCSSKDNNNNSNKNKEQIENRKDKMKTTEAREKKTRKYIQANLHLFKKLVFFLLEIFMLKRRKNI
jgi:hypothetical protein